MICLVAGMVLKNNKSEYLITYRLKKPQGLSFPSFHLATERKEISFDLGTEFRKRAKADINIAPTDIRRHFPIIIDHPCRFGKPLFNIYVHKWIIYEVLTYKGEASNLRPEKYHSIDYLPVEKILNALERKQLDPVWEKIFLNSKLKNLLS